MLNKILKLMIVLILSSVIFSCEDEEEDILLNIKIYREIKKYETDNNYIPGISVCVYSKSNDLNFSFSQGYSAIPTKEVNTINTPHILYSITKSFVASEIIKLVNEGKISLQDKLSDYIENLNEMYINSDATISELLCHRSGIGEYTENYRIFTSYPFTEVWDATKILDFVEIPSNDRDENGKYPFRYSSTNYILLSLIIEKVTGEKLNDVLKKDYIAPLNLSFKLLPQDEFDYSTISHPHVYPYTYMNLSGDGKTPIDITTVVPNAIKMISDFSFGAGGMIGCAEDTAKWGYNLLSENGDVDRRIRDEILNSVSSFDDVASQSEAYGYGVRKLFYNGYELIGSYGRGVGDENLMFYNKDKDVCIVIFSSSNTKADKTPNIDDLMYAIFDLF